MQAASCSIILLAAALLHAADRLDLVRLIALALGELDDQIVAQHAPRRHVAPLGLCLPPHPQLADDRQAAAGQVADARNLPPPRPVARFAQLAEPSGRFPRRTTRVRLSFFSCRSSSSYSGSR